jgi:hypothetical protein
VALFSKQVVLGHDGFDVIHKHPGEHNVRRDPDAEREIAFVKRKGPLRGDGFRRAVCDAAVPASKPDFLLFFRSNTPKHQRQTKRLRHYTTPTAANLAQKNVFFSPPTGLFRRVVLSERNWHSGEKLALPTRDFFF